MKSQYLSFLCQGLGLLGSGAVATAQSNWSVDSLYQGGQAPATHDRLMAPVSDLLNHKHLVLQVSQRSHLQAAFLPGQWLRYEFLGSTAHVYAEHRLEVPDMAEVKDLFYNAARRVLTCKLFYGGSRVGQIEDLQLEFADAVRGQFFLRQYPATEGPLELTGTFSLN